MNRSELRNLQNKYEYGWSKFVVQAGYPEIKPVLMDLIGWLEDMNDPEAQTLAPFLAEIGQPLIPYIRRVFDSDNDPWKCYVLWHIVDKSPEIARVFHKEIEKYAVSPTSNESSEGIDEIARQILNKLNEG